MDATQLFETARILFEQHRVNDCIGHLRKVLEIDPRHDHALALYARCFYQNKEYEKGIGTILNAIKISPDNSYYFYLLGFGYYKQNVHYAAIHNLQQAINMNPQVAEYFGLLAFIHLSEKNSTLALEKANEGLQLDAENITCLNARSRALTKLRKKDEAQETMLSALQTDPDNEFTHLTVGWNLLERGRRKEATHHFREALRIDPNFENAKAGLKEALKSKIPPYKWLLQYSFWIRSKGKTFRWLFVFGLFFGVRLVIAFSSVDSNMRILGMFIAGCYFMFIIGSWVINPLANLFLLFDKDGKYALDHSEKWSALTFLLFIVIGMAVICSTPWVTNKEQYADLLASGFILLSFCIPAGYMRFPIRLRSNSFVQWLTLLLLFFAIISLVLSLLAVRDIEFCFVMYCLLFILYMWVRR
ncbi:MAG TPA: tetratricopeptide repeat protein [Chitinophagaceae bacterium]